MNIQRRSGRLVAAVVLAGGALVGGGVASGAPQGGCLTQAEYDQLTADRSAAADQAQQVKTDARTPESPGGAEVTAEEQAAIADANAAHTAATEAVNNATVCEDNPPTEPPPTDSDGDGVPDSVDEFPGEPPLLGPIVEVGGNGSAVQLVVHNPNDPKQIISTCGPTGVRDGNFLPEQWTSGGASITYYEEMLPDGNYTVTVQCNSKGGQSTSVPVSFTVATDAGMPIPATPPPPASDAPDVNVQQNNIDVTVPPNPDRTPLRSVPSGPLHV
ncbi:MAG: hypothetical protein GX610_21990 [Rhodococcus sp.]|nr:hypothetical protein [Rhodococcus sp. (in: high G+C Gram-positive bacteria)]